MDTIITIPKNNVDRKKYLLMCVEILKNHAHKDLQVYVESEIFRLSNGENK
jgi:hypothetical protein